MNKKQNKNYYCF